MKRGMTRGNNAMRGRVAGIWEAATQQPAGQVAQEAMAQQEATVQ